MGLRSNSSYSGQGVCHELEPLAVKSRIGCRLHRVAQPRANERPQGGVGAPEQGNCLIPRCLGILGRFSPAPRIDID